MDERKLLLENNRRWADGMKGGDPTFFERLASQQDPRFLWIGCSDSRVPANQIVGLAPGEIFVHRNVGNVVAHTDLNCLSVLQYAIDVLAVQHVIVCGHDGCGGVTAAMDDRPLGLIDNWLRHIRDVYRAHQVELDGMADERKRRDRLTELHVIEQVANVCHTTIVQDAWRRGTSLSVVGWVYDVADGLIRDLDVSVTGPDQIGQVYRVSGAR
jgi:carbonic anhydrase